MIHRCLLGSDRNVVRVAPSVSALQRALAHGCRATLGVAATVGPERRVCGETYDAVVVAVPPTAVKHALEPGAADPATIKLFDDFHTETHALCIHRDASLMPADRGDWRCLNVVSKPGEACQRAAESSTRVAGRRVAAG